MTNEFPTRNDPTDPVPQQEQSPWKRRWIIVAEVVLVLIIVGLLIATWLPAFIGARPGINPGR